MTHGIIVALVLIKLTDPSGNRIDINAAEVNSVRETLNEGHLAKGSHCLVVMGNGRFIAVQETCEQVRQALRGTSSVGERPCIYVCGETERR